MSELTFGDVGGNVTVQGDMTAGDKILQHLDGMSPARRETLRPVIEELVKEREAETPNPSKIEGLLQTAAKAGIPALLKIITELLIR